MMSSKLKWLIVIQLLLTEQALCRVPSPMPRSTQLPGSDLHEDLEGTVELSHQSVDAAPSQLGLVSAETPGPEPAAVQTAKRIRSAKRMISVLKAKLQGKIEGHLHMQGNISCQDLLSASTMEDPLSFTFPQELLGLSLVPVLVVTDCLQEAQILVLKLYDLLGVADTEELLMEVESLIERRTSRSDPSPTPASAALPSERARAGRHMEAVMFNIQQLATLGAVSSKRERHCEGWIRVNQAMLVGAAVEGSTGSLKEALSSCEKLGSLCAGVTSSGSKPRTYQATMKKGSRILPSVSSGSKCWIRQCSQVDASSTAASGRRMRRSRQRSCINQSEQRVYDVVEWIPGVSTLYNLGTAVYYASVNCPETAKERAILTAVDLGTDALMVATGGTAGVAGYAVGAGVKTTVKAGVRYLFNSMNEEDDEVLVNQFTWEEDGITIQ